MKTTEQIRKEILEKLKTIQQNVKNLDQKLATIETEQKINKLN